MAGEIQYCSGHLKKKYFLLQKTKKEILEILSHNILTIVSVIDPDIIILYTELIDDVSELENELLKRLPREGIPCLKKIDHINEYILVGLLHLCLSE